MSLQKQYRRGLRERIAELEGLDRATVSARMRTDPHLDFARGGRNGGGPGPVAQRAVASAINLFRSMLYLDQASSDMAHKDLVA